MEFLRNVPDDILPTKVALITGVSGAYRSDELFKMEIPESKTYQSRAFIVNNK